MLNTQRYNKNKRGQVAVLDLFIAIMIFGIIIATVMVAWNNYIGKIDKQLDCNTKLIKAYHISDLLTKYPGKPSSWDYYSEEDLPPLTIIGLAYKPNVLDEHKLSKFTDLDYDLAKKKLNIESYDFYFNLTRIDGGAFDPKIAMGIDKIGVPKVVIRRYVIYNEKEAMLEFGLQE
ncbi:hypothetical protein K8R33_02130 [archaeon]|nr:hypothetical protein [archaeon]